MSTETTIPDRKVPNPFVNVKLEIKLDELLSPEVKSALAETASGVKMTVSKRTVRNLQTKVWDGVPTQSLLVAEQSVLVALEALGIDIRADEPEPEEDDGAQ